MKISKTDENEIKALAKVLSMPYGMVLHRVLNSYLTNRITASQYSDYLEELNRLKNEQRKEN